MALIRAHLPDVWRAADLLALPSGRCVIAGMVICRQRPGTAKGFVFVSLEDETGISNAIVPPRLFEKQRLLVASEPFLLIEGIVQNEEGVIHLKAEKIEPCSFEALPTAASHDFH